MEEINLEELFKFFWSKKVIIIITTILFAIFSMIYVKYIEKPMYHSSTTVILVSQTDKDTTASESNTDLSLNKQLVSTYSEIIKNSSVLDSVIKDLKLNMTTTDLANLIDVTSVNNTEIIKIEVSNENNELAKDIVVKVTDTFIEKVNTIYNLENITILSEAKVENEPYNISFIKQTLIGTMIGFILSFIILFLTFYFDTTVKSSSDIENKLNMLVLGSIAKVGDSDEN